MLLRSSWPDQIGMMLAQIHNQPEGVRQIPHNLFRRVRAGQRVLVLSTLERSRSFSRSSEQWNRIIYGRKSEAITNAVVESASQMAKNAYFRQILQNF